MSYKAYRDRVLAQGGSVSESIINTTKRQVVNYILDSPSLRYVYLNMFNTIEVPCIVSNVETYEERRFLFLPDMNVHTGDYISYQDMNYLATDMTLVDGYTELFGELCSIDFPIAVKENRVKVGVDIFGKPEYRIDKIFISKPAVMTEKTYSQVDNSPMPLPEGTIIIKLPYSTDENEIPKINVVVDIYNSQYKITAVNYQKVINNYGYIQVQLQRMPNS